MRGPERSWVDVPVVTDAFVVNIGDLMEVWTNSRWVSTVHRVLAPVPTPSPVPRMSLAYFHHPNWDADISLLGDDDRQRTRATAMTAGTYIQQKIDTATQARAS